MEDATTAAAAAAAAAETAAGYEQQKVDTPNEAPLVLFLCLPLSFSFFHE